MERITSWTQALVVHAPSGHSEGNSAFETGGVHASDEPDHGVGPQRVAHGDRRGAPEAGAHGLRAAADLASKAPGFEGRNRPSAGRAIGEKCDRAKTITSASAIRSAGVRELSSKQMPTL